MMMMIVSLCFKTLNWSRITARTMTGAMIARHLVAGWTGAGERAVSVLTASQTDMMTAVSSFTTFVNICVPHSPSYKHTRTHAHTHTQTTHTHINHALTLSPPIPFRLYTVCHTGLTHHFNFWHSGTLALSPERQSARMSKIKNSGLDQYGAEPFEQQQFGTAGDEGVNDKV